MPGHYDRRIDYARRLLEGAFKKPAPLRSGTMGIDAARKGTGRLEELMAPYMGYLGGQGLPSDRTAATLAPAANQRMMRLKNALMMAGGRGQDISNIGRRRSDAFNLFRTKKGIGQGLERIRGDIGFKAEQGRLDRESAIKMTKERAEYERKKAKEEEKRLKDQATSNAWIDFLSAIPGLAVGIGTANPMAGYVAYQGSRNIGRELR